MKVIIKSLKAKENFSDNDGHDILRMFDINHSFHHK